MPEQTAEQRWSHRSFGGTTEHTKETGEPPPRTAHINNATCTHLKPLGALDPARRGADS